MSDASTAGHDVAIVGGGPAGLAVAIGAALQGLSVVVLEHRASPVDKACGEGLMPAGLACLDRLGVRGLLDPSGVWPIRTICYVQEDGSRAEASLPGEGGLGVRRTTLADALLRRAREVGVSVRHEVTVRAHERSAAGVVLHTSAGDLAARMLVAADGLASPLRRAAGLDTPPAPLRRLGLRQHFRCAPWSPTVEVHFAAGLEAYVTPAGPGRVGVAFLWEDGQLAGPPTMPALLARFPALAARLYGVSIDSRPQGAGPLLRGARARVLDRFALVGDAAGYVDALTGEGLSIALASAEALVGLLPRALAAGATAASLAPYERLWRRTFAHYAFVAHATLVLARRPWLRRPVVRLLGRWPALFRVVLAWAVGG